MDPQIQRIVDLVHRRDELLAERTKLTAEIDRQIAAIESQIISQRTATGLVAVPTGNNAPTAAIAAIKPGSHAEKIAKLLLENPSLTDSELARKIYGDDNKTTRHNLGAVLWGLRKSGRLPPRQKAEVDAA